MKVYSFNQKTRDAIRNSLSDEVFCNIYKSTVRNARERSKGVFEDSMQKLITRIGMIVARATHYPQNISINNTAAKCISDIIGDSSMELFWKATQVNEKGNQTRHRQTTFETSDYNEILHQYNRMISKLIKCGFNEFGELYININREKRGDLAENCFMEKHSIKHVMLGCNKIKMLLSPSYCYDEYTKTINTAATLFWQEATNERVEINIKNLKTGKNLVHETIILGESNKKSYNLPLKSSDLKNSSVNIIVTLKLKREKLKNVTNTVTKTVGTFFKRTVFETITTKQKVEYIAAEEKVELCNTLDKRFK